MTVLDVDEVEAGGAGHDRGAHEVADEGVELGVGERADRRAGGEAPIEDGVRVGRDRLPASARVGPRVAARVGELQADDQAIGAAGGAGVLLDEVRAQRDEVGFGVRAERELVRVGAAVVPHGERLAAPDQRGAAAAEAAPAPAGQIGRPPIGGAVPALHRQDAEPVARRQAAGLGGLRQRRAVTGRDLFVERERHAECGEPGEELWRRLQGRYAWIGHRLGHAVSSRSRGGGR